MGCDLEKEYAPFWLILFAILIAAYSTSTQAQLICGERSKIVSGLKNKYAEEPISMGLANNGALIEVLASEIGTFTIIMTQPNGTTCLMVAGDAWGDVPRKPKGGDGT